MTPVGHLKMMIIKPYFEHLMCVCVYAMSCMLCINPEPLNPGPLKLYGKVPALYSGSLSKQYLTKIYKACQNLR